EKLNKHFSDEFDQFIIEIDSKEKQINNHKNEIERFSAPDKARLFPDYQKQYEEKLSSLYSKFKSYADSLEVLLNKLKEKREKPFDALVLEDINSNQTSIENLIIEINKIIDENNQKVKNFENEKSKARETLLTHLVAKAIDETKYFVYIRLLNCYDNKINQLTMEKNKLEKKINVINNQIKSEAIGAEKINTYLTQFFNDDKLKLKLLDNGKYQIYREDVIARNLSTGEKNIIALIYFFVRLEEKNFNLSDSIVFIDDPVSSLDSNHTFKVYGFLAEKVLNCKQLFITTHNFDFFNLLKDLVKSDPKGASNKQNKNEKENYYLIKKITSNSGSISTIENLPDVLKKFKSEYNYLFSILKQYNESQNKSNFELLYILPNIARRFLEAYLFQKYPDGKKFKDKCDIFFKDTNLNDKQTTLKILDEYSHEENPEHSKKFPDINEVEICIKCLMDTIENKDKEHYDALLVSIGSLLNKKNFV
ncbi:MAG: AAA family ATPase, partial [Candidatus Omnitrophica bacterium]|nr:AAA family ATPase [Candidatus Omnitrophota bacterium]